MNKAQVSALNVVGGICGLLIACDLVLGVFNSRLNMQVSQVQFQFSQAQQVQNTTQNLVIRIAQAGEKNPVLKDLLARHDFHLNVGANAATQQAR